MENGLLIILSITTLFVIYWIVWGQRQYNDIFRDYFQPSQTQTPQKKEDITIAKDHEKKKEILT